MVTDANILWYLFGIITGVFGLLVIAIVADERDKKK